MRAPSTRPFSRMMPKADSPPMSVAARLTINAVMVFLAIGVPTLIWQFPFVLAAFTVYALPAVISNQRQKRRLELMLADRKGLSICQFARSFDRREVDPWVIRAVYVALQGASSQSTLLIIAADQLIFDLGIDHEDLDTEICDEIAYRTRRSLNDCEHNPLYSKVHTAHDLVHFFNAQPRVTHDRP
jgi:hypothetical protein